MLRSRQNHNLRAGKTQGSPGLLRGSVMHTSHSVQYPSSLLSKLLLLSLSVWLSACGDSNHIHSQTPLESQAKASAREASSEADLLSGPLARGVVGDYVLENDKLRVIIQRPGRRWFGVGSYGGNIIDVSAQQADGSFLPDHMEEFVTGINIENTPNYTDVSVVNDGANGGAAVICASGPDDLLDYVNASSIIRGLGFVFPDSADDRDLPIEIETCYRLEAGHDYITMDTTVRNRDDAALDIYLVEYLNGSGQVEAFQTQAGFGEPFFTAACPAEQWVGCAAGRCDPCNLLAYSGVDGAAGVSYGLIHEVPGSSSISTSGVNVLVLGYAAASLVLGAPPNFTVPAAGELSLRRYFAVGDGSVASIAAIRNDIFGYDAGTLSGSVTSAGEALVGAQVAVYQDQGGASLFVAGHDRTDSQGRYKLDLPPGNYQVRANREGYEFDPDDPASVTLASGGSASADFDLPSPGYLQVTVTDQLGPVPAKLQLVGFDPSPPLRASADTGLFGDVGADATPYGIAVVDFIDRSGRSERITVEPGEYQLVLSRGPRYSVYKERITIQPGITTTVQAEIARVIATEGYVHADFHVHSIDSPDAEVTREERVAVYLAEGMDFFTPSDHDIRVDFAPTLEAMQVSDLIGTASSSETTTFDYGHFNSWPTTVDPDKIGGGAVDWGREALPGMDFPAYASYVLSPAEIFAALLADPKDNVAQINHMASHFNEEGLAIDTGVSPPTSSTELSQRRLDPNLGNAFDDGFDSLEVWIGTNGFAGIEDEFLGQNAGDWFNMINQGIIRTGIANSDSHDRRFTRIAARNQLASTVLDPGQLSAHAEQLASAVREGKTAGTNAPFIEIEAEGPFQGSIRRAALDIVSSTTLALDAGADVALTVQLSTPAWAALDSVEFYINNQPTLGTGPEDAARYIVCPDRVIRAGEPGWQQRDVNVAPAIEGAIRTDISVALTLPAVTGDTWVVAIARGTDGVSEPLFPVLPASLDRASNTTLDELIDGNLGEGGTPAFAFTNPLFIDVGGNGWTPPGIRGGNCPLPAG